MGHLAAFALLSLTASAFGDLTRRQSPNNPDAIEVYLNRMCSPEFTVTPGAVVPPCISVRNIQGQCEPKVNSSSELLAHARCLCDPPSSFFSDWAGCQQCLFAHGGRSQANLDTFNTVVQSASAALCTGTPTADFAALYASAGGRVTPVTTGGTVSSDRFPSQTAVSLYFTPPGPQGPGPTSSK